MSSMLMLFSSSGLVDFAQKSIAVMLLGAKLGDVWGRRRAFVIGSIVYAVGSLTTALSPNVTVLFLGWSIIEGLGAVLVIPAIAALIADNYDGHARVAAYAIIGAASGAAVPPATMDGSAAAARSASPSRRPADLR